MSVGVFTVLLALSVLIFFVAGLPVAFTLGGIAMIFGLILWGPKALGIVATTAISSVSNFILLAIPLFLFMALVLQSSGLADSMFRAIHVWAGRLRGGLAMGVVIVCTFMAAMVGVIGPGVMTMGTIALPAMLKRGYDKYMSLGVIMAGGALGMLIPPSIDMIVYSSIAKVSLGKMFAGGIIPGLILSTLYIIYIGVRCKLNPAVGPPAPLEERSSWKDKAIALKDVILAFFLIISVLGSIFFGLATPTEAAAIGGVGAILCSIIYRRFSLKVLKDSAMGTMKFWGMVAWMVIGASLFGNIYMFSGGVHLLEGIVETMHLSPWAVIILMQISILLLGCFMDDFVVVLLTTPLYVPMITSLGFDPLWFGVLMMVNLQVAFLTPPYGFALFYMRGVVPKGITMRDIYISILPFIGLQLIGLVLCMVFPQLITWLPGIIMG